ncbi:OB-fold domain-containing protein [Aquabacter sp. L1I39]|uniref:Zn-ribbon domain-containing OB-fold protein n=1 Tax=Aquabacter sp. L1I39 TaxID=2820278 RepID=UPI001ADBC1CB|nr:OB-fold domain-containing protein [Aquabacter sp. L1I39]QTL04794.1 OB-fold domain-containing protein [Aquabacter sp. L1I39]
MAEQRDTSDAAPPLCASAADKTYLAHLATGAFHIQRCDDCGKGVFYPRAICPHCGGQSLSWFRPSGAGTVYSTTTVRGRDRMYNVCLVDLDEGPRLMSRVVGMDSLDVKIGLRVTAKVIETDDGTPLLVFERMPT